MIQLPRLVECGSIKCRCLGLERKINAGTSWAKGWANTSDCEKLDRNCPRAAAGCEKKSLAWHVDFSRPARCDAIHECHLNSPCQRQQVLFRCTRKMRHCSLSTPERGVLLSIGERSLRFQKLHEQIAGTRSHLAAARICAFVDIVF